MVENPSINGFFWVPPFMETSIELFLHISPPHGRPVYGATSSPAPKRVQQDLGNPGDIIIKHGGKMDKTSISCSLYR